MNAGAMAGYTLMYIVASAAILFLVVIILRWAIGTSRIIEKLDEQNEYLKNIMVDENAIANKIRQKERPIKVKSEYLDGIKDLIK